MIDPPPSVRIRLDRALGRRVLSLPPRVLRRLAGPARRNDRGDELDVQVQLMLRLDALVGMPDIAARTPAQARADMARGVMLVEGPARPVEHVWERSFGGVPCRVYTPLARQADRPALVYAHGGGWVAGDLRTHDRFCRRLAHDLGWTVVAVDYRRAPEHPFPTPVFDLLSAFEDAREHAELFGTRPERVALGGDSAGGSLTAAVTLALRDRALPQPLLQVLVYPAVDMPRTCRSHALFAEGYLLTRASIAWYLEQYAAPDDTDPLASPLAGDPVGLAPAVVAVAGFDPLRDEGERYAEQLEAAGVRVWRSPAPSLVHGYAQMDGAIRAADAAVGRLVATVGRAAAALGA